MSSDTFSLLSINQIHELVSPVVERLLKPRGFELQKPLHWVRNEDAPIRQIFSVRQWKGGQVAPAWGVSLDFVPDFSGAGVKLHRTHKSAIFDLCVDARDSDLDMPYTKGAGPIIERVERVISQSIPRAEEFWSMARSLQNLPSAIEWLQGYLSRGFYNYTQAPLAAAFILAKVGRPEDAKLAFAQFLVRERLMVDTKREKLFALLDSAIAEGQKAVTANSNPSPAA